MFISTDRARLQLSRIEKSLRIQATSCECLNRSIFLVISRLFTITSSCLEKYQRYHKRTDCKCPPGCRGYQYRILDILILGQIWDHVSFNLPIPRKPDEEVVSQDLFHSWRHSLSSSQMSAVHVHQISASSSGISTGLTTSSSGLLGRGRLPIFVLERVCWESCMFNYGSLEGIYDISLVQVVRPKFVVVQTMKSYSALHTPEEFLAA
jgi:hypothetical protein